MEECCEVREQKGGKEQNLYLSQQHPCPKNISKRSRNYPVVVTRNQVPVARDRRSGTTNTVHMPTRVVVMQVGPSMEQSAQKFNIRNPVLQAWGDIARVAGKV